MKLWFVYGKVDNTYAVIGTVEAKDERQAIKKAKECYSDVEDVVSGGLVPCYRTGNFKMPDLSL